MSDLGMGPFVSAPVFEAPASLFEGDPEPAQPLRLVAELFRHPDYVNPTAVVDTSASGRPDGAFAKRWQDRLNEPGTGELTLPGDSELLDVIQEDDLIRFSLVDRFGLKWAAFSWIVEDREQRTIAENDAEQIVTLSGPGHLAMLSESVVYPSRGVGAAPVERDRVFNWTSPQFDDSAWGTTGDYGVYGNPALVNWEDDDGNPLPALWPDLTAHWIGPSQGSPTNARPSGEQGGFNFFRKTFTVPTTTTYAILFACDNIGELYIDSQLVAESDGWTSLTAVPLDLTAGEHTLAIMVANENIHLTGNPTGCIYSIADYTNAQLGTVITNSDGTEKIVEFPNKVPGFTPGEVLRIILEEAQARGELQGWTWSFTDQWDSKGNPWPETGDIGTKVGTDYLTFIGEMVEAPWIDVRASRGGLRLDAYVSGKIGSKVNATYTAPTDPDDPTTGNIVGLIHRRRSVTANRMLLGSRFPWREVEVPTGGARRKTATLGLGAAPSQGEVDRIGQGQLGTYANVRSAITIGVEPYDDPTIDNALDWIAQSDIPYIPFNPGDVVTVPDHDMTPIEARVHSITVEEDENSRLHFGLEVNDVFLDAAERDAVTLKKMANGTLMGDRPAGKVATPIQQLDLPAPIVFSGGGGGGGSCDPQVVRARVVGGFDEDEGFYLEYFEDYAIGSGVSVVEGSTLTGLNKGLVLNAPGIWHIGFNALYLSGAGSASAGVGGRIWVTDQDCVYSYGIAQGFQTHTAELERETLSGAVDHLIGTNTTGALVNVDNDLLPPGAEGWLYAHRIECTADQVGPGEACS